MTKSRKITKCKIRLMELNNASKPSPTKLDGSQVARENYIRRRVATLKPDKKGYSYGPLFGLKQTPKYGGECKNIYYANHGSSSDVTKWKRLYGGPRILFSNSACQYGCGKLIGSTGLKLLS